MLGSAFVVDLAVFDDWLEPGEVLVVMRDDNAKVWRVESVDGGVG